MITTYETTIRIPTDFADDDARTYRRAGIKATAWAHRLSALIEVTIQHKVIGTAPPPTAAALTASALYAINQQFERNSWVAPNITPSYADAPGRRQAYLVGTRCLSKEAS